MPGKRVITMNLNPLKKVVSESTHDIDKALSENKFLNLENDRLKQENLELKKTEKILRIKNTI